ncbi:hypothetical protein AVEN_232786-2 [Araneus ventricosus]|uniref:Uncharacterized protein n=1 Tax=Araneus ventricosus TaxID=182803 RepID=A0A4Y2QVE0_ARAVE|nr:hypothetical protein AVEN_134864-1 [Araneus ventricosus]GBN67099.1 hypothetical protein AVEN_232786-2 [Araneus ventricosus]
MPVIEVEPPSIVRPGIVSQQPSPKLTVSVIPNESTSPSSSSRRPLLSSELQPSGSPNLDVCRSSFSSTTEISFCSSDNFGGRRESVLQQQEMARPGLLSSVEEMKSFTDEVSPSTNGDKNKTTCLDIEDEGDETSPRMSPDCESFLGPSPNYSGSDSRTFFYKVLDLDSLLVTVAITSRISGTVDESLNM